MMQDFTPIQKREIRKEQRMEYLEMVEKLREKTGVSYEDARNALEASNYNMLDAIVYLEQQCKIPAPKCTAYSTEQGQQSDAFTQTQQAYEKDCRKRSTGDTFTSFFKWCEKMLKKSCETSFEVIKEEKTLVTVPVLVLILCGFFAFWVTLPLLIVGMFMGCRYRFIGFENTSIDINDMCQKASKTCENIKNDFQGKKDNQ